MLFVHGRPAKTETQKKKTAQPFDRAVTKMNYCLAGVAAGAAAAEPASFGVDR